MTDKEKRTGRKDCSFCPFLSYTGTCKKYNIDSDKAKHKCDKISRGDRGRNKCRGSLDAS